MYDHSRPPAKPNNAHVKSPFELPLRDSSAANIGQTSNSNRVSKSSKQSAKKSMEKLGYDLNRSSKKKQEIVSWNSVSTLAGLMDKLGLEHLEFGTEVRICITLSYYIFG